MKTKEEIVNNWLPRYTGRELKDFTKYILLTNFDNYVRMFAEWHNVPILGEDKPMMNASADGITIINFGMGSPNAATMLDLLSAIAPEAVLFLGKCGGLKKKSEVGDFILPIAAIRVRELRMIISLKKCLRCRHLPCKRRFRPLSAILGKIIGQELFIQPIGACGSGMMFLKSIYAKYGPWPLIWKLQQFL